MGVKQYTYYAQAPSGQTVQLWSVFADHEPPPDEVEAMWVMAANGNASFPRPTHISIVDLVELPASNQATTKAATLLVVGKNGAGMVH